MAKKKITVEEGGKLNEQVESLVEKSSTSNHVDNKSSQASDPLTDAGVPELTEEQKQYARITVRQEFNKKFSKWAEIDPVDATDDDIAAAKKDFEDCVDENKNKTYLIATHEDGLALKTAEFLQNWNKEFNTWENGAWRGIIQFDRVITKIIDELKTDTNKDFEIDYSTLIFLYQSMGTPKGSGIVSARKMAEFENYNEETGKVFEENIPVTYSGVLEKIQLAVKGLSNIDKKLTILKERVNLAYAGLKMNLKISELEEFLEFHEAITAQAVADNPDVKAATGEE
ncbi:MAG: hypothetical protein [Hatfieldvirus porci]|uniref:Uncharacterized protein n=1 Tax=phage Lak_Megaphage_RVC_JS4_GC31 TaxID=3109228 RepID=A0ABZ0Z3T1_9CAUD|nr:MAG: hypothetical protein [phage Lak_Megaphage_RVC_AP3_GC31]WQJ52755.1 MAG: hypothetical protein [phage Lak_Megaphage_RVC_JS4_GC31]